MSRPKIERMVGGIDLNRPANLSSFTSADHLHSGGAVKNKRAIDLTAFESLARQPPARQSRYGGGASLAPPVVAAAFLFVIPGGVEESLIVSEIKGTFLSRFHGINERFVSAI